MAASHGFELIEQIDGFTEWLLPGNGLRVLTASTPVAPVVSFGVVYLVGSRHERTGETGATHLLEHLMFKGSERYNRAAGNDVARVLQRVGASFNASTWLDRTSYYETVPVDHFSLAVDVEADRMRGALLAEEDLASERTVVLNELEMGENDPVDLLLKHSYAMAYLEHPYRHPTIGWRADVETIDRDALRSFYDRFYHPANAVAIVVGDITAEEALAEIQAKLGVVGAADAAQVGPVPRRAEPPQRGERRFEIQRAGDLPWMALSWRIPDGVHPDLPALSVLGQILSEGVTSRLYQALVEPNHCLAAHVFPTQLHDPGLLHAFASVVPGVEPEAVEARVREEIRAIAETAPAKSEVERARTQVQTDLAFHRESPGSMTAALTEAVAMGDWTRFVRELEDVSAVTPADVCRVAGEYLRDESLTVGWFLPTEANGGDWAAARAPRPRPCYLHEPFAERVQQTELDNGARLASVHNPFAPTVTLAGTLLAGRSFAPPDQPEVASLTAAMLKRGTRQRTRLELARELEDRGLELSVDAPPSTPTLVTFSAQGLAEHADRLVELLVEVLRWPVFPVDELDRVRERALAALARERTQTSMRAYAALSRQLYSQGHPHYIRSVEEREAAVAAARGDALEAHHRRTYGPSSLVLGAVGDVAHDRLASTVSSAMADWTGGQAEVVPAQTVGPAAGSGERVHLADRPNVDMFLGQRSALCRTDPDYPAAWLANSCLGYSTLTSRLGRVVRDQAGLTYGISSRFFGTIHQPGPWAVRLSVAGEHVDRAETLVREEVRRFCDEGPSREELAEEREAQAGAYMVALATNGGLANELVLALSCGQGPGDLDSRPRLLRETSLDAVRDAVRSRWRPDELVATMAGSLDGVGGSSDD